MHIDILIATAEKGGVENVINDIVPYLQSRKIEVRVVQIIWEGTEWVEEGIPFFHLINGRKGNTVNGMITVYADFLRREGAPDVILATVWPMMSHVARRAIEVAGSLGTKIISWMHSSPIKCYSDSGYGGITDIKDADGYLAISQMMYEEVREKIPGSFIRRVCNPVDISGYQLHKSEYDNRDVKGNLRLCFVGRIEQVKGLEYIINALALIDDRITLMIVGTGDDTYVQSLRSLSEKLNVNKRITWYGWQKEPWDIARQADIVVMASNIEGFPLVAIEALANGIPVISTPASGIAELIRTGENGYIFPFGDYRELAQIINDINTGEKSLPSQEQCISSVQIYDKETAVQFFYEQLLDLIDEINSAKTVDYVDSRRKSIETWNKKYAGIEKNFIQQVNGLLVEGTLAAYDRICGLFEDAENVDSEDVIASGRIPVSEFKDRNDISYLINAVNIYYAERETGNTTTIFSQGSSLQDIIDVMRQIRFLLWEIEFSCDDACLEDSIQVLVNYVLEKNISVHALVYLLRTASIDKYKVCMSLADPFEKIGKYKYELQLLLLASENKAGDKAALTMLAELYGRAGRKDLADSCRGQILDRSGDSSALIQEAEHEIEDDVADYSGRSVTFVLCTNDPVYTEEALYFIGCLEVPQGCEVSILTIEDATSMTSGYNEGMNASDAKYKVYLHQDVMILNTRFLYELFQIFEDRTVGMIGMVGAPELSENRVMWCSRRIGKIYSSTSYETTLINYGDVQGTYEDVEVIDGLLMATQYDIPWRDDLLDKWDMYDVSQSLEFKKAGYRVVVPCMDRPWCLHDDGFMNLDNYFGELDKIQKEYYEE